MMSHALQSFPDSMYDTLTGLEVTDCTRSTPVYSEYIPGSLPRHVYR
jgi:hypothetical protein